MPASRIHPASPSGLPRRADGYDQNQILRESLRRMTGASGLVVFDLDSTLLDNRPRQARIVRELGESLHDERLLQCAPEDWAGWDLNLTLTRLGLSEEEIARIGGSAKAFWRERFFTSTYCADDIPIAGATSFVAAVASTGIVICYVTGRHEEMRAGTIASFRTGGFLTPNERQIHLLMKPRFELHDDAWKREVAGTLTARGGPVVAFDNEPTHVNGYQLDFPDCYAVHLDTDQSGRPVEVLPQIPSIRDFRILPEPA